MKRWNNKGYDWAIGVVVIMFIIGGFIAYQELTDTGGTEQNPYTVTEYRDMAHDMEFTDGEIIYVEGKVTAINVAGWVVLDGIEMESALGDTSTLKVNDTVRMRIKIENVAEKNMIVQTGRILDWRVVV